jgi:hypothetical protein
MLCRLATTWAHNFPREKRPRRLACYTCEDAGSLSFRARCVCSRIGAGHWRCCASEKMVRGNDELSSCNQTGQTMTCRSQGDICSRPLHFLQASVRAGQKLLDRMSVVANRRAYHRLRSLPAAATSKLIEQLLSAPTRGSRRHDLRTICRER